MKTLITLSLLFYSGFIFAQPRNLIPGKKSKMFGKRDLRDLRGFGLQSQFGLTYLMTSRKKEIIEAPGSTHENDSYGKLGIYGEVGMIHFPKKRSKLSLKMKTVLVSYFDWGIGFKYFRGGENTNINYSILIEPSSQTYDFRLEHGNVYGRFSLHKNIHFKKKANGNKSKIFLDNSLGINIESRIIERSTSSSLYMFDYKSENSYNPPYAQIHYGLGLGVKLKRGSYIVTGIRAPILGYQSIRRNNSILSSYPLNSEHYFGNPSLRWFSSKYWPILFQVKYMFLFEKKQDSCRPALINSQDKETQKNRK
ncbi:MAG: hypothetical protein CL844_09160 [Crocinitomicaceae bacterium]|nr:hypothetical protein [Crocinitomicaceae bacterium]|tara:strand:+ start:33311 stop:34237 length:927 start_codon:yes stop_codon:yes gene_type:complete